MSERFWEVMCAGMPVWGILFGLSIVFLVFSAMTLYLATPEAGAYHVLVINVVLVLPLIGALGYTIRKCRSGDF